MGIVTQCPLDCWTLGPLRLLLPGPVLVSQWYDGIEPFGHLWGFFPDRRERSYCMETSSVSSILVPSEGRNWVRKARTGRSPGVGCGPSLFPSCCRLSPSQAHGLQVALQMAQQQTPSWADLTHRVFVFMFDSQDREQENCFHWDQPQLFLQKQLVERLCCFWSRYAMKWSLDEGQMYYLGKNPGSFPKECSVVSWANKWNCSPMFCLCRDYFRGRKKKP